MNAAVFKHTPGPWFTADWSIDDGPNEDVIEAREPEIVSPGSRSIWPGGIRCLQIASVRDSSVDAEATAANARLIAAAPELLEACKAMSAHYSGSLDHQPHYVAMARAAIAKATGVAA